MVHLNYVEKSSFQPFNKILTFNFSNQLGSGNESPFNSLFLCRFSVTTWHDIWAFSVANKLESYRGGRLKSKKLSDLIIVLGDNIKTFWVQNDSFKVSNYLSYGSRSVPWRKFLKDLLDWNWFLTWSSLKEIPRDILLIETREEAQINQGSFIYVVTQL